MGVLFFIKKIPFFFLFAFFNDSQSVGGDPLGDNNTTTLASQFPLFNSFFPPSL